MVARFWNAFHFFFLKPNVIDMKLHSSKVREAKL